MPADPYGAHEGAEAHGEGGQRQPRRLYLSVPIGRRLRREPLRVDAAAAEDRDGAPGADAQGEQGDDAEKEPGNARGAEHASRERRAE